MPTAEENQAAAKDPRVGDRWKCNARGSDWLATVTARDNAKAKAKYTLERDGGKPIEYERTLKDFTSSIYASGWELIERGPAPAAEKPDRDPRIDPVFGDELKCTEGHTREVGQVGKNGLGYECVWYDQYTPGGNRYIREVCSLGEWREINRGAEILAYGDRPAPAAKPERDPYTTPVVGDFWEIGKGGTCAEVQDFDGVRVSVKQGHRLEGQPFDGKLWLYPLTEWINSNRRWTLHRRGDDPAWRPPEERAEQPAPGIKVGDRVRLAPVGEMGNVTSKDDYGVKILFDGDTKPQTFSHRDVEHWLTIIPPAADASTDDEPPTPAPFATYQSDPVEEQHYRDSKYIRSIRAVKGEQSIDVDVYEVLEAFNVTCPARQHALKKLLCAGLRNKGSVMQDLREAEACVRRAMEMQYSREAVAAAKQA